MDIIDHVAKKILTVKIKKICPFVAFFDPLCLTLCRLTLCRVFDPLSFDPVLFDPLSFDPVSFDPGSFDPLSVNLSSGANRLSNFRRGSNSLNSDSGGIMVA